MFGGVGPEHVQVLKAFPGDPKCATKILEGLMEEPKKGVLILRSDPWMLQCHTRLLDPGFWSRVLRTLQENFFLHLEGKKAHKPTLAEQECGPTKLRLMP